nr:PREDICTED: probable cytosolic oligopeptidase A [Bemisia tabaci]
MALPAFRRSLLHLTSSVLQTQYRTSYYILLPELGQKDTEKLQYSVNDSLPDFRNLSLESCASIVENSCIDYSVGVRNLHGSIKDKEIKDVFKEVFDTMEKLNISLESMWGVIKVLFLVDQNIIGPELFTSITKRVEECRRNKFDIPEIYNACKACDVSMLSEEQARVVRKFLSEGKMSGVELRLKNSPDLMNFNLQDSILYKERRLFTARLESARGIFQHTCTNRHSISEFPKEVLETMVEKSGNVEEGPWLVTLSPILRRYFLEYCSDRDIRWNFYQAEERAGSTWEEDVTLRNSQSAEEIRKARRIKAKILGYPSYFHQMLDTKIAGSLENVEDTLAYLLDKARSQQDTEIDDLQSFINASGETHPIQLFDLPYWARIHKKAVLNFDDYDQRVFFPLPTVFQGLLDLCSKLFHISFKEVKDGISTWHPDVKFYHVYRNEETKPCGAFYTDLVRRDGKYFLGSDYGWTVGIREHSLVPKKTLPISALVFNFTPGEGKDPPLLPFSAVQQLFAKFGHVLQNALCEAAYSDVSGLSYVEFEAVEAVPHFLANWLYDDAVFASINGHYKTGEKLNLPLKSIQQHLSGFKLCHELFKSHLDLRMHATDVFWKDIVNEIWPQHYTFPRSKWNSLPCQFSEVFSDGWAAAYYSRIWSQMIAADMTSAFHEENQDSESVGLRFRDTFLTFGGSCHASEVFRRFRGRDPSPTALLKQLGLIVG